MKPVFADTGFFLALVNARDQYHQTATSLNASLITPLLTTAWVLLEFANAIATSRARSEFGSTLARLRSERDAEIIALVQSCLIAVANSTRHDRIRNGR